MPRPKPDENDLKVRVVRQREWCAFRTQYLFSQKKLAEVLGISRRTVQQIEAGRISPHQETLRLFSRLKEKYESEHAFRCFE